MDRDQPATNYARAGELHIAYQTLGEGPRDIVFVAPLQTNVDAIWDFAPMARYLRRLSEMGRVVLFDAIGTGLSDPLPELSDSVDSWTTDVRVVLDAVGIDEAVIHAFDSAATMSMLFAATYPDRVSSLVLVNTFAYLRKEAGYPLGIAEDEWHLFREMYVQHWGTGEMLRLFDGPDVSDADVAALGRLERQTASPGALLRYLDREWHTDVRDALPMIQAPTLVIHRAEGIHGGANGRYLADHIPGARYVELAGKEQAPFMGDFEPILQEMREFLTGVREVPSADRALASILFTDIVDSTRKASSLGDRRWREMLDAHDECVAAAVATFEGRVVKSTGDGVLATFMGPGRAIAAARAIDRATAELGLEVRAGAHTGECELRGDDIGGVAVHIAARIASLAGPRQLLVSRTVKDLVAGADLSS